MSNVFSAVYVNGNDVYVTVAAKSVSEYKNRVAEESNIRRTKRFNVDNVATNALFKFIRSDMKLKGKHIHVHILVSAGKEGLYRNAKGHFVKPDTAFTKVVVE